MYRSLSHSLLGSACVRVRETSWSDIERLVARPHTTHDINGRLHQKATHSLQMCGQLYYEENVLLQQTLIRPDILVT